VHTDLLAAGAIPDPLADANEQDLAWVADCDWAYSCDVELDPAMGEHDRIELKFEGLDTLAAISLNGRLVGETAPEAIRIEGITDAGQIDLLLTRPACWRVAALLDR
jgi:beta-mannosidase